jgi:hypothetical protein
MSSRFLRGSVDNSSSWKKYFIVTVILNISLGWIPYINLFSATISALLLGPLGGGLAVLLGAGVSSFYFFQTNAFYLILLSLVPVLVATTFSIGLVDLNDDASDCYGSGTLISMIVGGCVYVYFGYAFFTTALGVSWSSLAAIFDPLIVAGVIIAAYVIGLPIRYKVASKWSKETKREKAQIIRPKIINSRDETVFTPIPVFSSLESEGRVQGSLGVDSSVWSDGEYLKIAIRLTNEGSLAVTGVTVTLDAPEGLEFSRSSSATARIGSIGPDGAFQTALYWLKPIRCVDDSYGGMVVYRDAMNRAHTLELPKQRIVNVCPMLEGTNTPESVFRECKYGSLERNNATYKFRGNSTTVFALALARVSSLVPVEKTEETQPEGVYFGYSCFVGKTKYGNKMFAAEIQASGNEDEGILTMTVYSDDKRILSGFFIDIMEDIRQHILILSEKPSAKPTICNNCGAPLNLTNLNSSRLFKCDSCGSIGKVPPWMA